MFKFLHAADLHLDSPLHGLERYEGAPVDEIRGASRRALDNLVQLAIEEEVKFVLLAGDLYDGNWRDHNTGLFFVSRVVKLRDAGIAVYGISGNHDAASKMTRSLPLPNNPDGSKIMLSDKRAETVLLEPLGVAIHGQGFARATVEENVVPAFPAPKSGHFNIGLLHTSLDQDGSGEHPRYAPCALQDLKSKGYQYWALGHIHQRAIRATDPVIAYPGNIQGRHIREAGAKGCLLVTVDDSHTARAEFRALDVLRWADCEVAAEAAERRDDVVAAVAKELARLCAASGGLALAVRVRITGRCPAHQRLLSDARGLAGDIRAAALDVGGGSVWIEKVKVQTTPTQNLDDKCIGDGPLGELLGVIREYQSDDQLLTTLGEELEELDRKLPAELVSEEGGLRLLDRSALREALDEVRSLLIERLESQGAAP